MFAPPVSGWRTRVSLVALAAASGLGCPQLLRDDFAGLAASSGDSPSSSAGGTAGAPGPDASAGGIPGPDAGGAPESPGPSDDAGIAAPLECDGEDVACGERCVNLALDADNCGTCGSACGHGRTCQAAICDPRWVATGAAPGTLVARERGTQASMDGRVFIWGGVDADGTLLQSGAVYDTTRDEWSSTSIQASTPSARVGAAAVWTGSEIIVWGGGDASNSSDFADGGRYDPSTREWRPLSTLGAPSARRAPYVFWTGARMLLWSGIDKGFDSVDGQTVHAYDPASDTWSASSAGTPPPADLFVPAVALAGSSLYVLGGSSAGSERSELYEYDSVLARWLSRPSGPSPRSGAFAAWDGAGLVIWGGSAAGTVLTDGARWVVDPTNASGGAWVSLPANDAFARALRFRETGWAARVSQGRTLFWGGVDASGYATDAALFDASTNAWVPVPAWPSAAVHLFGFGVWSGDELVLWGGRPTLDDAASDAGERFRP